MPDREAWARDVGYSLPAAPREADRRLTPSLFHQDPALFDQLYAREGGKEDRPAANWAAAHPQRRERVLRELAGGGR